MAGGCKNRSRNVSRIIISDPFPRVQNRPQSMKVGDSKSGVITVTNNGTVSITLSAVTLTCEKPSKSFHLPGFRNKFIIMPGLFISFNISCQARCLGIHEATIQFDFDELEPITKYTSLACGDDISSSLGPDETYTRQKKKRPKNNTAFVPGIRPPGPPYINWLPGYDCPKRFRNMFEKFQQPEILLEQLSSSNYVKYFSTLLWAEEYELQSDIQQCNMQGVRMRTSQGFLVLTIPGLPEKHPSVVYGDAIYARPSNSTITEDYQGFAHRVGEEEVHLKFSKKFHTSFKADQLYDIRFLLNRVSMRKFHQAIEFSQKRKIQNQYCFPTTFEHQTMPQQVRKFYQGLNPEQQKAVTEILNKKGASPYIVFGPPGTGKTRTLIESILQVRDTNPDAVILACATTNVSTDILVEKLSLFVSASTMLRINPFWRRYNKTPKNIQPFCHFKDNKFATAEQIKQYRIVVCTYSLASSLHAIDVPAGHFTHIFLDEAGQATEPESLIPITTLAEPKKQAVVVLAGDHHQLGPVIKSKLAAKFGLGKSLMERLMMYYGNIKNSPVTKLVTNYRSHPDILQLPSRLFYENQLIPAAGQVAYSLCDWEMLPNKKFPFLFVNMNGMSEREGNSPSWFNPLEATMVVQLVESLTSHKKVKSSDIGIITPYRQQVKKITKALRGNKLGDIKVGSVEQFQGLEKRAIFISTVRSRSMLQEEKAEEFIGFLADYKRFNVAVTRAIALVVIVGNADTLCQDGTWKKMLDYCRENGSFLDFP